MDAALELSTNGGPPARHADTTAPQTVSARQVLRAGVPEIFRRMPGTPRGAGDPFAMRFLLALEEVLDPVIATLDSLPAHFDADLAPEHALMGLATWLGVDDVEDMPAAKRREAVRRAGELGRLNGTRAGLELALHLFFPDLTLRVADHGSVVVSEEADERPPMAAAEFEVVCDQTLAPELQMAVARCIDNWKPVQARYKLRVRRGDTVKTLPDVPVAAVAGVTPPEPEQPEQRPWFERPPHNPERRSPFEKPPPPEPGNGSGA
jgi:phage tail-like protein